MVFKIELKNEIVNLVSGVLQNVYTQNIQLKDHEGRLAYSIGYTLADKFESKTKKILQKSNMLNTQATSNITLKYHEAWSLYYILQDYEQSMASYRDEIRVRTLINELNQKLV